MELSGEKESSVARDRATVEDKHAAVMGDTTEENVGDGSKQKLLMVENLTKGFIDEQLPQLLELREKTKELTKNQAVLIETIEQENQKFSENKEIEEFTKMISVVRSYYAKLRKVKSEMDQLDERMAKLKKRSLKLKEKRQKRDLDEAQKREHALALERELTAKPAT